MSQNTEAKMISERDAVLRERAAADKAIEKVFELARKSGDIEHVDMRRWAENVFPLPKVTRPREVRDPTCELRWWRFVNGRFETRIAGDHFGWVDASLQIVPSSGYRGPVSQAPSATAERVAMWADLLANPTEEVPADA